VKKHLLNNIQTDAQEISLCDLQNQPQAMSQYEKTQAAMQVVFDVMEVGLERVSSIVQNMSITKSTASNIRQAYDINQCINAASAKLLKQLPHDVSVELVLAKLPVIYIDTYKIGLLLGNLLTNASEAISREGLITICSRQHVGQIEISITDNGCGIEKDLQEQIFDPCYTTQKLMLGTGLGLAISRFIATEHGGSLDVCSKVGEGSMFTLLLPTSDIIIH
jgi:two-component system NtrC family sensor kinase